MWDVLWDYYALFTVFDVALHGLLLQPREKYSIPILGGSIRTMPRTAHQGATSSCGLRAIPRLAKA